MDIREFLDDMDSRYQTTRAAVGAIPSEKLEFRPAPDMMTARELALHILGCYRFLCSGMAENDWSLESFRIDLAFRTTPELLTALDEIYGQLRDKLAAFPSDAFELRVKPFGVEQKISAIARGIAEHEIHHRGQLYVYLRLMGATPPDTAAWQAP